MCLHLSGNTPGPQKWAPKWVPVNPRPESAGRGAPNQKTMEFVTFEGLPASCHTGGAPPFSGQFRSPLSGVLFGGHLGLVGGLLGRLLDGFRAQLRTFEIAFPLQLEAFGHKFEFFQSALSVPLVLFRICLKQYLALALDDARACPFASERIRPFATERAPFSGPVRKPPLADRFCGVIWAGLGHLGSHLGGPFECIAGVVENMI